LLTACGGADDSSGAPKAEGNSQYKVAVLAPMTGVSADLGARLYSAVDVLAKKVNAEGGIKRADGSTVTLELVKQDDQGTVEGSTTAVRKAARDADAIVGGLLSSPALASMDVANAEGVPFIIAGAIASKIEEKIAAQKMKYIFHSAPNGATRASADMQAIIDVLGAKNLTIVAQDTDYGRDMGGAAEKYFKEKVPGGTVRTEYVPAGTTQYSAQLQKIRRSSPAPDAVYALLTGQEIFSFMQQWRSAKMEGIVFGGGSTASSRLYIDTLTAAKANGTMTNSVWVPEVGGQAGQEFVEAFQKSTGRPPADVEVQGYDAMLMLIEAVKTAKSTSQDDVAAALVNAKVEGLRGPNSYDPQTHGTPGLKFVITQIQNGEYVPLWPKEYAKGTVQR
jgi:branched-chain amino acid transport system substrate-binding protein